MEETLDSLQLKLEQNEKEHYDLKKQYDELWVKEKYGKYIGQFVKCNISNDGMPIVTKYLYIKSIKQSSKYVSYINIYGIGFDIQQWKEWNTDKITDIKFSFDNNCQIHIDIDDVKFEVITEDEWKKELKRQMSLVNKYVKQI